LQNFVVFCIANVRNKNEYLENSTFRML